MAGAARPLLRDPRPAPSPTARASCLAQQTPDTPNIPPGSERPGSSPAVPQTQVSHPSTLSTGPLVSQTPCLLLRPEPHQLPSIRTDLRVLEAEVREEEAGSTWRPYSPPPTYTHPPRRPRGVPFPDITLRQGEGPTRIRLAGGVGMGVDNQGRPLLGTHGLQMLFMIVSGWSTRGRCFFFFLSVFLIFFKHSTKK